MPRTAPNSGSLLSRHCDSVGRRRKTTVTDQPAPEAPAEAPAEPEPEPEPEPEYAPDSPGAPGAPQDWGDAPPGYPDTDCPVCGKPPGKNVRYASRGAV